MNNNLFLMDNRQLIPRWHTSRKSMKLQFPVLKSLEDKKIKEPDSYLEEYRERWKQSRLIYNATELNSALFIRGMLDDPDYKDTLRFLLVNENLVPKGVSNFILPELKQVDKEHYYSTDRTAVSVIIRKLKNILKFFPSDAMTWIDLAFYYSILGEYSKAGRAMEVGRGISGENSFVLNSYARYLVHMDEPDKAVWYLNRSKSIKENPLTMSASLSISTSFDISGISVSRGKKLLENFAGNSFFKSDLAACIGTMELMNGNTKGAKKMFKIASVSPSENTVSQYNWLYHKHGFRLGNEFDNWSITSPESEVNNFYVSKEYNKCRAKLLELHQFQPFSDNALADAGYISMVGLNDYEFVIEMSENRIPRPHMSFKELNNLVVAKLLKDKLIDIDTDLLLLTKKVKGSDDENIGVLRATLGLYFLKAGFIEKGARCYEDAIHFFQNMGSISSAMLAKHFYSIAMKEHDLKKYIELRADIVPYAKKNKKFELILKDEK
ncbi:hypothetical protein ACROAH_08325 [Shewanella oncorhynchi]|uniref:hypothetical protein n=1 Tax=Shewanella oncorhynchi TaxID=2726434 RepID=UPI003D79CA77